MYKSLKILKVLLSAFVSNPLIVLKKIFFKTNSEEFSSVELLRIVGNNPGLIIEAGSWNGDDTDALAKIFTESIICGVEPIPEMYQVLTNRFLDHERIKLYNNALSDQNNQTVKFHYGSDLNPSGSLNKQDLHSKVFNSLFDKEIYVTSITVDAIMDHFPNLFVNLLWLDIQGSELDVIKSIPSNKLRKIRYIHTEISNLNLYENQPKLSDFYEYLKSVGFEYLNSRHPLFSGNHIFGNAILTSGQHKPKIVHE